MTLSLLYFSHTSSKFTLFLLHVVLIFPSNAQPLHFVNKNPPNKKVSAVFVFGDSTSDPGNNNYIETPFKGNFPPYGKDYEHQVPTGRFTNGLLTSDFVTRYVGVKDNLPPYLDPSLTIDDLMSGVSFASAGSGFDPLTPTISNVISLPRQLEYFREYKAALVATIGGERTDKIVNNALYIVSAGTNDFVVNYFTMPVRRHEYDLPGYVDFVLETQMNFLQDLWNEGARMIGVAGLPPMGCLPIVITLYSDNAIFDRGCIDYFSSIARGYNTMLQDRLTLMQFNFDLQSGRIAYFDTYKPLFDVVVGHKNGFEEVKRGCCGTGLFEASFICNPKSDVCANASKYVFWDSIHPTQEMYKVVFKAIQSTIDDIIKD